jgi:hypothetical protein
MKFFKLIKFSVFLAVITNCSGDDALDYSDVFGTDVRLSNVRKKVYEKSSFKLYCFLY